MEEREEYREIPSFIFIWKTDCKSVQETLKSDCSSNAYFELLKSEPDDFNQMCFQFPGQKADFNEI